MSFAWQDAFTQVPEFTWKDPYSLSHPFSISTLENLKRFLDLVHIKFCLLRPFSQLDSYPLVSPQELLPSFETNLYEYTNLPGFSMVVLDRPISYFQEIFQFDILHSLEDAAGFSHGPATPLEPMINLQNYNTFISRLPKVHQEDFKKKFDKKSITDLQVYSKLLPFVLELDRGHVMAKNSAGEFYLSGVYASFPSDLDSQLKRFGLRIGKFKPDENKTYELNRNFVYQFLMELYGYPISSERRTSAALFARRLFKIGENFLISVLAQSDRCITNLYSSEDNKSFPQVEKMALVSLQRTPKEQIKKLKKGGFLIQEDKPAVILKVTYRQHKYDPNNVRKDRALSVMQQEVIHPLTGEGLKSLNIIKDSTLMTLIVNDITKGEFRGRIKYKRNEIVENTETHANRLKFLYAWLRKHQRRILTYSDEFYANLTKVLDNYLLSPGNQDIFQHLQDLYQEVWNQYSYIHQARKIKLLEDLKKRKYKGQKINYLDMLRLACEIIQGLKFEIVNYFDTLVAHAVTNCEFILNDNYLLRKYIHTPQDQLTEYGLQVRKQYGHLVKLVDDLIAIRRSRKPEQSKGVQKEQII